MTRRGRNLAGVCALLVMLACAAAPASAQQMRAQSLEAHGLRFGLAPGRSGNATITVRRGAREIARVARASDAFDPEHSRRWVFLEDANFDGYPDLWVLDNDAMANTSYRLELFDPAAAAFVAVPEFDSLSNPSVDRRNRRIATSSRGGCCQHSEAIYRWQGAQLELLAEWGDSMPEGDWQGRDCFVRLFRREREGDRMVDRPDRYVPMHVFNGGRAPSAECRNAAVPPELRPPAR